MTQKKTERKKLDDLNLMDKFLFDATMEHVEAYEAALSILMENEIYLLEKPETEKELRLSPDIRQVRLDVISMDTDSKIYYMEMQKENTRNLIRRSRYYQAQLDVSLLEPGVANFNRLNDACFILIAPFDIFGRGLFRYTFEGVCRECPDLKLEDGAIRIFINTHGTNREDFSQEFLDFMDYIAETTDERAEASESERIKLIHRNVKKVKNSEKMGVKYMQAWEEKVIVREEGRAEGRIEGRVDAVLSLLEELSAVPKCVRDTVSEEEDINKLGIWLKLAARANSLEEFRAQAGI